MAPSRPQICQYSASSNRKLARTPRYAKGRTSELQPASQQSKLVITQIHLDQTASISTAVVTQDLVFGLSFTDHMFLVEHTEGQGWGQPVIKPFGNIPMHPAAQALHYGVCCFEGMKGYLGKDGKARLFR